MQTETATIAVKYEVDESIKVKNLDPYSNKVDYDKFYTKEAVAKDCLRLIDLEEYDLIVEPSAGNGNFYKNIKHENKIGLDIKPESSSICQQDWFTYQIDKCYKKVLIVGNPPFGKRNQLSKDFIKHASTFDAVKTIAFILPDVYNKHTLQRHIPDVFRLKDSKKLPPYSFEIDGIPFNVPCTFFVFDKSTGVDLRFIPEKYTDTKDFVFGTADSYDFFVMGAAPKNVIDSPNSKNRGYYIKVRRSVEVEQVRENFKSGSWEGYSSASGGVCWLSKPELIYHYQRQYENNCG